MYSRIRELRKEHNLKQSFIAAVLNMSQSGYSKYETGENIVPVEILIELSMYYRTSVDYLMGLTDDRHSYEKNKYAWRRYQEYMKRVNEIRRSMDPYRYSLKRREKEQAPASQENN